MRILIIEDNKHKLRTVQEILKENELNKYEVTNCGEDAIVKIKQHRINLIILKEGFCWNSNDKTRETYNSQQAYKFLEKMKEYCKKENKRVPEIIFYSKAKCISKKVIATCETSEKLNIAIHEWIITKRKKHPKVLIVEDSDRKLKAIYKVLVQMKISNIKISNTFKDAENVYKNEELDLIILDMQFPYKGKEDIEHDAGAKLIKKLSKTYNNQNRKMPKIIVYSTIPMETVWKDYREEIPKEYLGQTVFAKHLKDKIRMII